MDFNLTEMDLSWSCTRWSITDSDQVHRGQVEVQQGEAELDFNLAEMDLIWSCTRRRTSTPRPSPSKPSPSLTRRSRVGLGLGWDGLVLLRVQLQCNVDEKGGKYTEAQPRCTCPLFESTLLRSLWWITECNSIAKFTRREASTPRRSRGVLVLPTSQLCIQVGEVHVQLLMDLMLVHWRFCFCKKVRIEWAEWLSDPILNNNAVRVSEKNNSAWWSTEEVKHFNYHGVQCPLYLCCSRISLNSTLYRVFFLTGTPLKITIFFSK